MAEPLDFRLLGPIEVRQAGSALPLARGKERALLAILLRTATRSCRSTG
ncbi:MAG TPA: hypothetical protein VHS03_13235 [Gaiellaceae bacterium]|nr:hypothetical protein [Gaiellaceae bacterium]